MDDRIIRFMRVVARSDYGLGALALQKHQSTNCVAFLSMGCVRDALGLHIIAVPDRPCVVCCSTPSLLDR